MPYPKQPRSAALKHLHRALIGSDPKRLASLEEERFFADLARQIYQLRTRAGLGQAELAKLAQTTPSVICRLEEADYHRCPLRLLIRVATALNRRVELCLVPLEAPVNYKGLPRSLLPVALLWRHIGHFGQSPEEGTFIKAGRPFLEKGMGLLLDLSRGTLFPLHWAASGV